MNNENAPETTLENQPDAEKTATEDGKGMVFGFEVDRLIRQHVAGAMALGVLPFPVVDLAALTAIQLNMARTLSKKFGERTFEEQTAKKIIASVLGGLSPMLLAPAAFSLLKFVPVVGPTIAGVTMPVLFGSITYVVGQVLAGRYVHGGGDKVEYVKLGHKDFREMFEKAKNEVQKFDWQKFESEVKRRMTA